MIIICPECHKKLRVDQEHYAGKRLALICRHCRERFHYLVPTAVKVLLAHGEPEVAQEVLRICNQDVGEFLCCTDADVARQLMKRHIFSAVLLDVSLPGAYPFELIEEIHKNQQGSRIVLLPSVYNKTAYKRRPTSLYGADAYLELHHLSDGLIPLLHELLPDLEMRSAPYCLLKDEGNERSLLEVGSMFHQAEELAAQLVADIGLYYQEQIDQGILYDDLERRMAPQLEEARRILVERIPRAELDAGDFLSVAIRRYALARKKRSGGGQ